MPTSLIFGFWDSRAEGYQHKHARILLTRIDAFDVVPCEKHALYVGPYSKDECATVVLGDPILAEKLVELDAAVGDDDEKAKTGKGDEKNWGDKMAERGFSNALSKPGSLGGIFADRIERLALISLTDIASNLLPQTTDRDRGSEAGIQEARTGQGTHQRRAPLPARYRFASGRLSAFQRRLSLALRLRIAR